jgi:hypothetical protein
MKKKRGIKAAMYLEVMHKRWDNDVFSPVTVQICD